LEREARVAHTASRVRELSWAAESRRYLGLIERLIARQKTGGATPVQRPPADLTDPLGDGDITPS